MCDTLKSQTPLTTKERLWATNRCKSWMHLMLNLLFQMSKWSKVTHRNWVTERIKHVCPQQPLSSFLLSLSMSFQKSHVLLSTTNNVIRSPNTYHIHKVLGEHQNVRGNVREKCRLRSLANKVSNAKTGLENKTWKMQTNWQRVTCPRDLSF